MSILAQPTSMPAAGAQRATPKATFDIIFRNASFGSALLVLVLLAGIMLSMVIGGWPAFRQFGIGFLTGTQWDTQTDVYGGLAGQRRHAQHGADRAAHRRAPVARHRRLPDPARATLVQAAGRNGRRAASLPCRPSSTACGASSSSCPCSRPMCRCRSRHRRGHADPRHHPLFALSPRASAS